MFSVSGALFSTLRWVGNDRRAYPAGEPIPHSEGYIVANQCLPESLRRTDLMFDPEVWGRTDVSPNPHPSFVHAWDCFLGGRDMWRGAEEVAFGLAPVFFPMGFEHNCIPNLRICNSNVLI
jgi:hypothetical protein